MKIDPHGAPVKLSRPSRIDLNVPIFFTKTFIYFWNLDRVFTSKTGSIIEEVVAAMDQVEIERAIMSFSKTNAWFKES